MKKQNVTRDPTVFTRNPKSLSRFFEKLVVELLSAQLLGNRRLWILSHLVMALGVSLLVRWPAIGGIMIAALLVGATFMINAMASMQEARAVAGPRATTLMAAMIAAFGTGQIVGPILVSYAIGPDANFSKPLLIASVVLILSVYALSRQAGQKAGEKATP